MPKKPKVGQRVIAAATAAAMLAGCAAATTEGIEPPRHSSAQTAQINVKQKFRMVGGGSGQAHDLFDVGSGIEYDASVPVDDTGGSHLVKFHGRISPTLFEALWQGGRVIAYHFFSEDGQRRRVDISDSDSPDRIVEDIEESLLDQVLLRKIDIHRGEAVVDPKPYLASYRDLDRILLTDPRGNLERVKLRWIFDTKDGTLYRFASKTEAACQSDQLANNFDEVNALLNRHVDDYNALKSRSGDFVVGEVCGLIAPFPITWNARYVGSFPGYSLLTWERAPGTMKLFGVIGFQKIRAKPVEVSAAQQYVGIYDPNSRTFVVEAYE